MDYHRCQPPCSRFITSDDPHSKCVKCMGFSHVREAVFGISKCKFCSALGLRLLKGSHPCFPVAFQRLLRPSVNLQPGAWIWSLRRWRVSRRASPFLSLFYLSTCVRISVEFMHEYLYPSPEAHNAVSFGLDDVLFTAASDWGFRACFSQWSPA